MFREDLNILVVDDVNAIRVQIRELLYTFGFKKVTIARNGAEAQVLLITETFQLILSDWHMDPVDGLSLLKFVRGNPDLKHIAFIMVTAENTKESVIEAIKCGVDDFLMKPLTSFQIQNKVFGVLLRKKVLE